MRNLITLIAILFTTLIFAQKLEVEGDVDVKSNKIINLADPVTPQDAATKAYVDLLEKRIGDLEYGLEYLSGNDTVMDFDSNEYKVVKIGNQYWTARNLLTTHYNNGTPIPLVTDTLGANGWVNLTAAAYCWPGNDQDSLGFTYGALYNYYTVSDTNSHNVCPMGWHVPTDTDWTALSDYLTNNGYGYQGSGPDIGKSLASEVIVWYFSATPGHVGNQTNTNNSTGFDGRPGGYRGSVDGFFLDFNYHGYWWSSTPVMPNHAMIRELINTSADFGQSIRNRVNGFSVRCVRD